MMLQKTLGIILNNTNYGENSIITNIYTREFGLQSYMVNGIRSKKTSKKHQLFQPLMLVDLVVSNGDKKALKKISEISLAYHFVDLRNNVLKSSIAFFLNEVLYKTLKEENKDEDLFDFIFHSLQWLDLKTSNFNNFHLFFLVQLSRYLGFEPQGTYSKEYCIFDLVEGKFVNKLPIHNNYLLNRESENLFQCLLLTLNESESLKLNAIERDKLINGILKFYQYHVPSFSELKTIEVLKQVLN